LVKAVPIEPKETMVDSDEDRWVWKTGDECHKVKYRGDGNADPYEVPFLHKGVRNAMEMDASQFAEMHDD
jgi:hypothetical protein